MPLTTTAPGRNVLLYDGRCVFCERQSRNLARLAGPGAIERVSFHDPGALDAFPGLTFNACMEAMHLVTADGKVYTGFEAAARAVAMRPLVGAVAYAYYVPGVRQLCDIAYKLVARYRYQLMGRRTEECDGGSCSLHFKR